MRYWSLRRLSRRVLLGVALVIPLTLPAAANAQKPSVRDAVSSFEYTQNMHPMGYSPFGNTPNLPGQTFTANSDLAFSGKYAFQGHYIGFRIIDISSSANPRQVSLTDCNGNQGDLVVYGDILVRSWNSPAPAGSTCDGEPVPTGFEGLHIFDISNVRNPELVGSVEISARPGADAVGCGSHTVTAVPDPDNERLVIYNQSGGTCGAGATSLHVFEIPLDDPGSPTTPTAIPLIGAAGCHDSGVILGDANLLACASGAAANVYDIGANQFPGGSLTNPVPLYRISEPGVGVGGSWHSAAFTWDGEVLVLGWEPGGGSLPECEATDDAAKKSWFFYDAQTGVKLGQFVLPGRHQRGRLHGSGERRRSRLRGSGAARPDTARRRLVDLLLQRSHLRVGHHTGPDHLEPLGQVGRRSPQARLPEPADVGVHAPLINVLPPDEEGGFGRPLPFVRRLPVAYWRDVPHRQADPSC
jgi:hypothetical protein